MNNTSPLDFLWEILWYKKVEITFGFLKNTENSASLYYDSPKYCSVFIDLSES